MYSGHSLSVRGDKASQQFYLLCPKRFIGRLQNNRYTVKTHILHKAPEEIHTYQPLADAVVTVYSGAECFLGVIQVYTTQIAETYRCVKLLKHLVILIHYIIACCIRVAGIKANSNARLVIHPVNDMSKLPELISHIATLPGCVLYDSHHIVRLAQYKINGFSDLVQTLFHGNLIQMAARMKIQ